MDRRRSATDRRGFLLLAGVVTAGAAGLAGCTDENGNGDDSGVDDPEEHDEAAGDDPDTADRDDEPGNTTGEENES